MSSFEVVTAAVADVSVRLGGISGHVGELYGRLGRHAGAGANTPAAGALDSLVGRWSQALPLYGLAGEQLSRAVGGAAEAYRGSDTAIAIAATPAAEPAGAGGRG